MAKPISSQLDFQKIPMLGVVPEPRTSAPSSPATGQVYFDTTLGRGRLWDGTKWIFTDSIDAIPLTQKGAASGVATLDSNSYVTFAQLPVAADGASSITKVVRADDARLSDQRVPRDNTVTGGTGTGSKIAQGTITDANVATSNKDGVATLPSMRTLGFLALQALAGTTTLDQIATHNPAGAAVDLNSQKIINLASPTATGDAANKTYVDTAVANARAGIQVKDPVAVALSSNINLAAPGATLDTVPFTTGMRFLAAGQTNATQNGIYVWNGAATAATRSSDADEVGEVQDGTLVAVGWGTYAGTQWMQTALDNGAAPGSWSQTWTQFTSGGQTYLGGAGLKLNGTTFDILAADGSIVVGNDDISVGLVPVAKGGTGATTAAAARAALAAATKVANTYGALTAGAEATFAHGLGTLDVTAQFFTTADGVDQLLNWRRIDANTIGVTPDLPFAAGALRVVVTG